jgi:pyruvate/oxaloacetate carboxyltransferase
MKLLVTERYSGVQAMNKTIFEEKYEEGVRDTIRENIEDRFGALPVAAKERLNEMSLPELKALRKKILQANSLTDLGLDG